MDVRRLEIPEILLITPARYQDERGFFSESYSKARFAEMAGITDEFVQDNHSRSNAAGTVRGMHFQTPPMAQGKLVRALAGAVLDIVVDVRHGSPTFGKHVSATLSAENGVQIWVPAGFAHGVCTLEPNTELGYKATQYYSPDNDAGIAWDDPDLGIEWPAVAADAIVSEKDSRHPRLADLGPVFPYGEF